MTDFCSVMDVTSGSLAGVGVVDAGVGALGAGVVVGTLTLATHPALAPIIIFRWTWGRQEFFKKSSNLSVKSENALLLRNGQKIVQNN